MILGVQSNKFSQDANILAIGIKTHSDYKIWKRWEYPSEKEMLSDFITYFLSTDDKIIIGFNVMKFDIPFLMLKSLELPRFGDFFKKINFSNVIDLFIILTFAEKGEINGLNYYLKKYRISQCVLDREMVKFYEKEEYTKFEHEFRRKLKNIDELFRNLWGKARIND